MLSTKCKRKKYHHSFNCFRPPVLFEKSLTTLADVVFRCNGHTFFPSVSLDSQKERDMRWGNRTAGISQQHISVFIYWRKKWSFGSLLYKCSKLDEQYAVFQLTPSTEERYRQMTPLKRDAFHLVSAIVNYNLLRKHNFAMANKRRMDHPTS